MAKIFKCTPAHQVHPQAEQESILGHFFAERGRFLGGSGLFSSFRPSFGATTIKNVNFLYQSFYIDRVQTMTVKWVLKIVLFHPLFKLI